MSTIDLPALQTQLASLERQKSLLTSQLLTLRPTHPLSTSTHNSTPTPSTHNSTPSTSNATPTSTTTLPAQQLTDEQLLSQVFASSTAQQIASQTRLHRITGITAFTVRDPSPPHDKLLGIRIEIFTDRKFHTPHYLLLSFPSTEKPSATFIIHRHTLPPYLPLSRLTRTHARSLAGFVRALRRTLLLHARRVVAVKRLKEQALAAGRLGDVTEDWTNRVEDIEWDAEVALVVVTWRNGTKGWIRIEEGGEVGKVVVKDGKGRREPGVERKVGSKLEGVAERMGWKVL